MKANEYRKKNVDELNKELLELRREQFNLRMQNATGQLTRTHQLAQVKKNIARVKTLLVERASTGGEA